MKFIALWLILFVLAFAPAARAEDVVSPFSSSAGAMPTEQPATAKSGIVVTLGRAFVSLQRNVNRAINDRLMAIKRGDDKDAIWGGLLVAFLYGVFHALGPGHGKTIVIGYFLGRDARPWRGVGMASWIALSHVVGAVAVVGIAHLILSRNLVSPNIEFFWLRVASYVAIIAIGLMMLLDWVRGGHANRHSVHSHHGHDHGHHAHDQADHAHGHVCHAGDLTWADGRAPLEQRLLAVAAGFVPCSGAILILLFTLANGLIFAGMAMAAAIAFGMGLTLAGLGVASILLRHQVTVRLPEGGVAARWLALTGPVLVIAIGVILLAASLVTQISM